MKGDNIMTELRKLMADATKADAALIVATVTALPVLLEVHDTVVALGRARAKAIAAERQEYHDYSAWAAEVNAAWDEVNKVKLELAALSDRLAETSGEANAQQNA